MIATTIIRKYAGMLAAGMLLLGLAWGQKSGANGAAGSPASASAPNDNETLRQYADKLDFGVGVLVQPRYWKLDPQHREIMAREFNRAVSYAVMIQKERGHFDFDQMDEEMKFAKQHNMKLFGAGLIYRRMTAPAWLHFEERNCGGWSRKEIDQIIKDDVQTIVRHGGDMFYAWEVVNEPIEIGHNACWSDLMGGQAEMIAKASQYVHEANPNVPILLNDAFGHSGVRKEQADEFFDLIRRVRALGGRIDVAGTEMHLRADELHPDYVDEFKYFLEQARKNDLKVEVTEIDVYQGREGAFPDPYENQKTIYYNIAHACVKDPVCTTFTVWGLYDTATWLRGAQHLTDANPVLFDANFKKKPAYYGVLEALKEGR